MEKGTVKNAVETLREEIDTALKGQNVANDIKVAVYKMMDTLNIPASKS